MNYIVVYRAQSAPIFMPDDFLRVRIPQPEGDAILTLRTRQLDRGLSQAIPGNLWIDVRGSAKSLENAISTFGNSAASVIPIIAFSANAGIEDMTFHLAYENSPNLVERQFIQNMIPDEGVNIQKGRKVNVDATRHLMRSIEENHQKEIIIRAISQYSLALRNWIWGYETLATAHLYMGMEALSKAVVKTLQETQDKATIAKSLDIDIDALNPCERLSTLIEAGVRRKILFQGDKTTYKNARQASDGFEHGFLPFDEIRLLAQQVRNKTARFLREGIINALKLDRDLRTILLSSPYDEPLGCSPTVKYIRGSLIGEGEKLHKDGNEYPILAGRTTIKELELKENGEYSLKFDETLTPILSDGIIFRPKSFEIWAP